MTAPAPLVEAIGARKTYALPRDGLFARPRALHAVDGVDIQIRAGETLGLVGESGCGKSTLGRLVVGLEPPSAGTVRFEGRDLATLSGAEARRYRRNVQIVFQNPYASLNPRRTVGAAIEEPLEIYRLGDRVARTRRAVELLEVVGLRAEHHGRYPHEFSGGQRQRICIARALALNPKLVVCDEPLSALDVSIRSQIINLLLDLQQRFALSYLFISHDLGVVEHISDRVAVMYRGRIVELTTSRQLYAGALHPYTRALLAAVPAADPTVRSFTTVLEGGVTAGAATASGCAFYDRCPRAAPSCARPEGPPLAEHAPGHWARCWRIGETAGPVTDS